LGEFCARNEQNRLKLVYNFYFIHYSLGRILILASPFERKIRYKVSMKSKVCGFGGNSQREQLKHGILSGTMRISSIIPAGFKQTKLCFENARV
jgi:hypothetical protein